MDDFGMLAKDFGLPQGKSAPMKSTVGSDGGERRSRSSSTSASSFVVDDQNRDGLLFSDVFGVPPKYTNSNSKPSSTSEFDYDSIFKSSGTNETKSKSSASTLPVYDKPVYDDDIFDGLPGLKSKSMSSSSASYADDVFTSTASSPKRSQPSDHFDDLLGNFGRTEKVERKNNTKSSRGLDDLIPGFGSGSPASSNRSSSEPSQIPKPTGSEKKTTSNVMEDPFVILESTSTPGASSPGLFTDPLEEISKLKSGSTKAGGSSVSGGLFDDIDPLSGFGKSFSNEMNNKGKDQSPSGKGSFMGRTQNSSGYSESSSLKKAPVDNFPESHHTLFDMPAVSIDSQKSFDQTASPPSYVNANYTETSSQVDMSLRSEEHVQPSDDIWLTVSEIPLFTQPSSAPPPSRPPPPIPRHTSNARKKSK